MINMDESAIFLICLSVVVIVLLYWYRRRRIRDTLAEEFQIEIPGEAGAATQLRYRPEAERDYGWEPNQSQPSISSPQSLPSQSSPASEPSQVSDHSMGDGGDIHVREENQLHRSALLREVPDETGVIRQVFQVPPSGSLRPQPAPNGIEPEMTWAEADASMDQLSVYPSGFLLTRDNEFLRQLMSNRLAEIQRVPVPAPEVTVRPISTGPARVARAVEV